MRHYVAFVVLFISAVLGVLAQDNAPASTIAAGDTPKVQGYIENENVINSGTATPQANLLAYGPIHGKIGWQFWGIASRTWSEGYIGPTYTPASWMTLALGVGAETGGARFGLSASGKKGRLFYLSANEWGQGSGRWFKDLVTVDVTSRISAGVWHEIGKGTGPTVNVRLFGEFRPYFTVCGGSKSGTTAVAGATYSFSR